MTGANTPNLSNDQAFDGREQIQLLKFIEVQELSRVPNMEDSLNGGPYGDEGDLKKLYLPLWDLTRNAGNVGLMKIRML